jgi:hypothetical protein
MTVADLLSQMPGEVRRVLPWASIGEVLRRMSGPPRIGALVVTAGNGRVWGTHPERDIERCATWSSPVADGRGDSA